MITSQTTDANDHDEFEPAPPDKLYAHHCRQLSAMMDGELSPDEAKFMLRRLEHDAALAGCWERWQVCGDALRGRRHALLPADFAHRVALAIASADEGRRAAVAASAAKPRPRLARWSGGAALAASVAVVAFLVAQQMPDDAGSAPDTSSTIVAQAPATPLAPAPAPVEAASRTVPGVPATETGAAALATAAVAVAEVPRRASERRARAQSRRTPDRMQARDVDVAAPPPAVAAADLPVLAEVPAADAAPSAAGTHPFAAQSIAPARPWPRAILSGYPADSAFSAGYGNAGASSGFDPFEPRLQTDAAPASSDTDADGTDVDGTGPGAELRDGTTPH